MRNIGRRLLEAKGARAFASEVAVVVIGVLLALGAQELVDGWSWQSTVAGGEQALRDEAAESSFYLVEQIMVSPCVLAQIDDAQARVRSGSFRPLPIERSPLGEATIRAPSRFFASDAWETLINDGTTAHMAADRALDSAWYYQQMRELRQTVADTRTLRDRLLVLAEPLALDPQTRFAILRDLAQLRTLTARQTLQSTQMLAGLRDLGRLPPTSAIERAMERASRPPSTIALCRERNLPLGDWRRALVAIPRARV